AGFVGLGTGGWVYQSSAVGQTPTSRPAPAPAAAADPDHLKDAAQRRKVQQERVEMLLQELSRELKETDLSDDAAKQLRDLLKAAEDQRAKRADLERQMLLSDLAKTIALLKKVSAGDPAREKAVDQFEAAFRRLGAQLDQAR